ncbi:hypothetical protein [Winogradskya humida]|uniref:Cell wall assembly regulator SMI1 n=1 Tax=Winogradskya humida TaxID=113566 RepID=A0ABQ3ZQL3_9ACTN|nr:hypothetical protein [Actinoplanes humidus]GIE20869.1 hypothetical protein Ahu01nite_039710 [Actinoplanes humidus]
MSITVDLPEPAELWRRWATLAAALSALGYADVWSVAKSGVHHDDGGGNWAHLAQLDGGRAVLYGYDHEYSATVDADPPVDLLAGAPSWLPWDELVAYASDDQLGYVLWHDDGQWHRVAYPESLDDGLSSTAGPVLAERAARDELAEFVFEWGEHEPDTPVERADVDAAATRLLQSFGVEPLRELLGRLTGQEVDLRVGLAVATRAGLTGDSARPIQAEGARPALRKIRKLSDTEHDRLVWAAMRQEPERTRPAPVGTGELGAILTWLRARSPHADGRCSLLVYADESSLAAHRGDHPPLEKDDEGRFGTFRELSDLVRRLRAAEADDAYGRWLFLHLETTATGYTLERRYDSWPDWWTDNGISGPWRGNLRAEVESRAERWRPGWTHLLDPEVAYRPADEGV